MASGLLSFASGLLSNPTVSGFINKGISAVGKFFGFGGDSGGGENNTPSTISRMSYIPKTIGNLASNINF